MAQRTAADILVDTFIDSSNDTPGQIRREQMVFLGNPEYGCDLQPIDFTAFARACGATGFTIDDPALGAMTIIRTVLGDQARELV